MNVEDKDTLAWLEKRFNSLERKVDELREIAESNERSLRGYNGEPGLVAEVQKLKEEQAACPIKELDRAFSGTHDKPGLFERVRTMENFNKNLKYWFVLLAGTIVVGIINAIIQIAMATSH